MGADCKTQVGAEQIRIELIYVATMRMIMLPKKSAMARIHEFSRLERILAVACLSAPALLVVADNYNFRNSISAYYNIENAVMFYVPLTVAFMLFVVNGLVKHRKTYNTVLGAALAGVVLFNEKDYEILHFLFATVFFLGNAAVIVWYSSRGERWFKWIIVSIIGVALLSWGIGLISLFWAEWLSLLLIGVHYILESWGVID